MKIYFIIPAEQLSEKWVEKWVKKINNPVNVTKNGIHIFGEKETMERVMELHNLQIYSKNDKT